MSNSAIPGGWLKSKPMWSNTFWVFRHVGFLFLRCKTSESTKNPCSWTCDVATRITLWIGSLNVHRS